MALRTLLVATAIVLAAGHSADLGAQRGRGGPPVTPQAGAPVDLTGLWVSVVTEDWRARMAAPRKGERPGIPLNAEGVAATNAWDPAKDEAAGETCRAYGAAGIMRAPGRLRISWADDTTVKIETEAGTQTRLLHFGAIASGSAPSWQGDSRAVWEYAGGRRGGGAGGPGGSLKAVTTNMRPGYVQKNGVPYGGNAILTEYFNRTMEPNGDSWLILTSIVEDPQYFNVPFIRSTHFKKIPDGSGWDPTSCRTGEPR